MEKRRPGRRGVSSEQSSCSGLGQVNLKGKAKGMILRRAKAHSSTNNWSQIAANIPGRCGKQCRERWTTILDPQFKHTAWTAEEDTTLLDCHTRVGNQWSIIAKSLPGRSQVRVRDRYKKLCRNGKVTASTGRLSSGCSMSAH